MTYFEQGEKVRRVTDFLAQETIAVRGKSTCYPTSLVNAAIAIGAIAKEDAMLQHPKILNHLIAISDLWNGAVQRIQTLDPRIAEVIETYLPIRIGVDSEIGRLLTVGRTFDQIYQDLAEKKQTHVIIVPQAMHAYAAIQARNDGIAYIDPLDPYTTCVSSREWFAKTFHTDGRNEVITTPVRDRVRVRN